MQRIALALLCAAALFSASSVAFAGGFAITTLDSLPTPIVAGQTYRIGFMVRQHGITPVRDATPAIIVTREGSHLRFPAVAEGGVGHYVAMVTFPSDGEWRWSVDQSPFPTPQDLGVLSVAKPLAPLAARPPAELALFGLVALAAGALGVVLLQVKRVTTPAATTATAQMASMLTQARRSTVTPSRS